MSEYSKIAKKHSGRRYTPKMSHTAAVEMILDLYILNAHAVEEVQKAGVPKEEFGREVFNRIRQKVNGFVPNLDFQGTMLDFQAWYEPTENTDDESAFEKFAQSALRDYKADARSWDSYAFRNGYTD